MNNKTWGWTQRQDYAEAWPSCGLAKKIAEASYTTIGAEAWNEVDMLVTVMIEAAKDNNLEFFESEAFEYYCTLIGLDHIVVKQCIYKVGGF